MITAALVDRVRALPGPRVIVGIVGAPGAGKSTLAQSLVEAVARHEEAPGYLPMDGFHLADVELDRLGLRHRKGAPASFDAAGYVATLRRLRDNHDPVVYAPAFERDLEQALAGAIAIPRSARVVVTEGNYLLLDGPWAGVRPLLDEVWFLPLDDATRRERLLARHQRFGKTREAALAWMAGNDDPNAALVTPGAAGADLVLECY